MKIDYKKTDTSEQFKARLEFLLENVEPGTPTLRIMEEARISGYNQWHSFQKFLAVVAYQVGTHVDYTSKFDKTTALELIIKIEDKNTREALLAELNRCDYARNRLKEELEEIAKVMRTLEIEYWHTVISYLEAHQKPKEEGTDDGS